MDLLAVPASQQRAVVVRPDFHPAPLKKKGKKHRGRVPPVKFLHPALLRGALNELDCVLTAKGAVLVPQGHPQYEQLRSKAILGLSPTESAMYRAFRSGLVKRLFGVDMPEMKVTLIALNVTPSSGVLTSTYTVKYSNINDNSVYTSMFDEYEFKKASLTWMPYRTVGFSAANSLAMGIAVIDYVDGTALASSAAALAFDSVKIFYLEHPGSECRETWHMTFMGPPDVEWIATGTSQDMAYWKSYAWLGVAGSTTYGVLFGEATVRFRQKHA
jgi:hypothetical protein